MSMRIEPAAQRQSRGGVHVGLAHLSAHREHHVRIGDQLLNGAVGQRGAEIGGMAFGEQPLARGRRHQRTIERLDQALQLSAGAARAAARDDERARGRARAAARPRRSDPRRLRQQRSMRRSAAPPRSLSRRARPVGSPDTPGAAAPCAARPGTGAGDRAHPRRCARERATPNTPAASAA